MKNGNIVFCMNIGDDEEPQNVHFRHEADIIAAVVAAEVEKGRLTPEEARKLLEPYRDVLPPLFSDEQKAVFDPKRQRWNDPDSFPKAEEILRSPQASQIFWYEADELGIEGVELFWSAPFPLLDSVSEGAMDELREAMRGRYEIVAKDEIHDESEFIQECLEWAKGRLEDAGFGKDNQSSEAESRHSRPASGETLVYGFDGQGGLVFLERDYAHDIRDFRIGLYRAKTWGDLRRMVSAERYRETVEAWTESEEDRRGDEAEDGEEGTEIIAPKADDDFDAEEIWGYSDGDWPGMTQHEMRRWVHSDLIFKYGHYVQTTLNGHYPVIDVENEEKVIELLETKGYTCVHEEELVWEAIWGG